MYDMKSLKRIFEMVSIVTISQIKSRYRKTFVGFLWVILGCNGYRLRLLVQMCKEKQGHS